MSFLRTDMSFCLSTGYKKLSLSLVESPLPATHSSKSEPAEVLEAELVGPAVLYQSVNFYKVN